MRAIKRLAVLTSSAVLATSGMFLSASPASAASCYGSSCNNKDPQATGCTAGAWTQAAVDVFAKTTLGKPVYAGRLELRGTNNCGSVQWARFTPVYGGFTYKVRAEQPESGYNSDWQNGNEWQTAWSNQIHSPRMCVRGHIITSTWYTTMEFYTPCL
ncbi:hypothetical protein [Streptomyces sp. NPDC002156]